LAIGSILKILEVLATTEKDDWRLLDGLMLYICFKTMSLPSAGRADEFSNGVEEGLEGGERAKLGPFTVLV